MMQPPAEPLPTKGARGSLSAQIGPFVIVPVWVLERCTGAPRALQLYAWLTKHANAERRAWPGNERLLSEMGNISLRSLERAITQLRGMHVLETSRRRDSSGAVVGRNYLVIQTEPQSKAPIVADRGMSSQPATSGGKQLAAGPTPVAARQRATDGSLERVDPANAGGTVPPPAAESYKDELDPLKEIQERPSTAAPPTRRRTLLDDYHDGFVARFGVTPVIRGAKDGKLVKDLATRADAADVRRMLLTDDGQPGWFFRTPDPFIRSTGYTVGVFVACFNKLLLTYQPPPDANAAAERSRMQARSDERKRELEAEARDALDAAQPETLERVKHAVTAEIAEMYPGIQQRMKPAAFAASVQSGMVRYVIDVARRQQQSPTQVVASYVESAA